MTNLHQQQQPARIWLSLVVRMSLFAVALLWSAGIWSWWEAWVLVCIWTVFSVAMTLYLLRNAPRYLLNE